MCSEFKEFYLKVSDLPRISAQGAFIEILMIFILVSIEEPREDNDSSWSEYFSACLTKNTHIVLDSK